MNAVERHAAWRRAAKRRRDKAAWHNALIPPNGRLGMEPNKIIKVTYRNGAFHPEEQCDLPEGFEATVTLATVPMPLTDPEERRKSLQRLLERMKRTPITEIRPNSRGKTCMTATKGAAA